MISTARLWFLALTAALGGFLFGFDTIVINGAEQDIFGFFGVMMVLHLFWAIFFVPETKGRALEEIA